MSTIASSTQKLRAGLVLTTLAAALSALAIGATAAEAAKPGNSLNAKSCQKGGWQKLATSSGGSFASEEECVSYAAEGGTLVVDPLTACRQELAAAGITAPADANYILGTAGADDFTAQLTAGNDVICGFGGDDRVRYTNTLSAGDVFLGGEGNDYVHHLSGGTFYGGADNDSVESMDGGSFEGGAGDDSITDDTYGGTFNGGAGNDSLRDMDGGTFNGGEGDDSVAWLQAGTFNGGAGNDSVAVFSGDGIFNQD